MVSTQSTRYRNSQLPCEEDVLPSAFEDQPLCVPRQLASCS